ncbi:polysaccharide biosynthesis protein [Paenibacillus albiflavus]|uniref:Polysaccharide biosynthesis protein n=1 Tax=Paenibacillus albiflavus TaxID=2545760 RepID=A0A4R4ECT7_9BACL|nr:oligosaccharide flippase family protein [Paenibacillus albiflavus]TCZ77509.1 polysaccharide biosynthesis protein [Paenibacillus albiflavus]
MNMMLTKATRIIQSKSKLLTNQLVKNTLWMLVGQGSRILIQAGYFILIARTLGANGFGSFAGVVALTAILSQFTSLGTGTLLLKHVAIDHRSFPVFWGNALLITALSGVAMIGVMIGFSEILFPETISLLLVISIAFSDLLFLPLLDLSTQAFQAFEKMFWTSLLQVFLSVSRLLAVVSLHWFISSPVPEEWGLFYLVSTVLSALIGCIAVTISLGAPSLSLSKYWSEAMVGIHFCMSQFAQSMFNDSDKTLLPRLASVEAAAIYTSAYRIIDVSFTPIRSLLAASTARFFKHGASGIEGGWKFGRKIFPAGCIIGALSGILLLLIAPFIPYILGSEYQQAMYAIQWLSVIPLLKAINYFAADLLTGSGFQSQRNKIQFSVVILHIAVNLIVIPIYSFIGAVFVNIGANLLLGCGLWMQVLYLRSKEKRLGRQYESI